MSLRTIFSFVATIFLLLLALTACGNGEGDTATSETQKADGGSQTDRVGQEQSADDTPVAVVPEISCFMTEQDYFDVQDFYIFSNKATDGNAPTYEPSIAFSFVDLSLRENEIDASRPYVLLENFKSDGCVANSSNIDKCLNGIYKPSFVRAVKTAPDDDELAEYGLSYEGISDGEWRGRKDSAPRYVISFDKSLKDSKGRYTETIRHYVYVSDLTPDGTYYAFTEIYEVNGDGSRGDERFDTNTVVEIRSESFEFLSWEKHDWFAPSYTALNIAFCRRIRLATPSYSANFVLDNSSSDSSEQISSDMLCVECLDSKGNGMTVLPMRQIRDANGNLWQMTDTEVRCYSPSGEQLYITSASYAYNALGKEVMTLNGYIGCADGVRVYVGADEIRVVTSNGESTYVRYSLGNFRRFYMTLLYHSFAGDCELSNTEKATVCLSKNLLLQLEITDTSGQVDTYKFYRVDDERALVAVNGKADFYVKLEMAEKVGADAQRVFSNKPIEAYGWE